MNVIRYRLFWSMALGLCFTTMIFAKRVQRECVTHAGCVGKGRRFRHEFQCSSCVPCVILNRQPPTESAGGNRCAATADSCGPCSPGYSKLTDSSRYRPEEINRALHFFVQTYVCEEARGTPLRIEILFGSLMLAAAAIVFAALFAVWIDNRPKKKPKHETIDASNMELVHTSNYKYENPIITTETQLTEDGFQLRRKSLRRPLETRSVGSLDNASSLPSVTGFVKLITPEFTDSSGAHSVTVMLQAENDCLENVEEQSAHEFLSSEDTIPESSRNSAYVNKELIISLSKKANYKSQPLPVSEKECGLQHSHSCPHLTDAQ